MMSYDITRTGFEIYTFSTNWILCNTLSLAISQMNEVICFLPSNIFLNRYYRTSITKLTGPISPDNECLNILQRYFTERRTQKMI